TVQVLERGDDEVPQIVPAHLLRRRFVPAIQPRPRRDHVVGVAVPTLRRLAQRGWRRRPRGSGGQTCRATGSPCRSATWARRRSPNGSCPHSSIRRRELPPLSAMVTIAVIEHG